jgi:surface antigen
MKLNRRTANLLAIALLLLMALLLLAIPQVTGVSLARPDPGVRLTPETVVTPTFNEPEDWKVYTDSDYGYSVHYPPVDWDVQVTLENMGMPEGVIRRRVTFFGPKHAVINIDIWDNASRLGLMRWFNQHQLPFLSEEVRVPSEPNAKVASMPAVFVIQPEHPKAPARVSTILQKIPTTFRIEYIVSDSGLSQDVYQYMLSTFEFTDIPDTIDVLPHEPLTLPSDVQLLVQDCCGYHDDQYNPYPCWGGNCTWWAAYRRSDLPYQDQNWGDARDWTRRAYEEGFTVNDTPATGAVGGTPRSGYVRSEWENHVAYVESFDGNKVYFSDMDWGGDCDDEPGYWYQYDWSGVEFIHDRGGPSEPDLHQCSDLTVSPSNPQVGATVTFYFDVCNDGDQSVTFQNIGPQGHGPPDGQGGLWNAFAQNKTVGAGQRVTVCPSKLFEWEGTWCIEHVPTQDQDGNWQDLPANGYRQAQCFGVGSVAPTPGDGATLYENENYGGQSETFTSDDGYLGDNPIRSDRASSVRVRGTYFTTLYEHPDYGGTAENFHYDDPNLSDNHIGNDTVSSLRVYPAVALYEHSNFGGKCETFVSNQANLSGTYIAQDTVSSIKIPSCYEVTLYEHPNYEGRSEFFTDDDSSLSNNHIGNDVVSSIKIERIVPDGITLFEHENFVGRNRTFTSDHSNLSSEYVDMASSVKIRGPFMAAVYEHPDYGGTGETFNYDDPDLRDNHIGSDTISSVRVWPAAALYEHSNYRGRCQTFDGDNANLSGTYIGSDTASSLKAPIGYLVTLCEHPDFEGTCQTFTSNKSNLSGTSIGGDTVSSITVAAAEDYDAENGGTLAEFWVEPGESFDVTISARNNGDAIWRHIHQVRLGLLTWNDQMGIGDLRRDLDSGESVASGATRSWTVSLTAPTTPGTYWQGWQMLREDGHVGWFGDLIRFEVHVTSQTYSISGYVTGPEGGANPLAEIQVDIRGYASLSTAQNGFYLFAGLEEGRYKVAPYDDGYDFMPACEWVTVPPSQDDINFVGVPAGPPPGVTFYEHDQYGGVHETYTADNPDLTDSCVGDNAITSVKIRGPYSATLYREPNYQGTSETFTDDDPQLSDNIIGNDTVSSICVLFGDLDGSRQVNVADIMEVASRWRMTDEDPDWDPRYDLDGDGIINIVDIMLVAAHWGETCP